MNIHHHADDSTLLSYAAGALPEGFALVLAAHLEGCDHCRHRVAEADDLGGELLNELPAEALTDNSLDSIWERIDSGATAPAPVPRPAPVPGLPAVLAGHVPGGLDQIPWRTLAPGIRRFVIEDVTNDRGTTCLLSIAPGTRIPHHSHGGSELTLVLKGSYDDEIGRFLPGDLADLDDSVQHQPVAGADEPCICLIATDERLRFTGMFSRLIQPLVGI